MCHKLWAFSSQKLLSKKNPSASNKMKPDAFLGLNRADAPCFCTKKKGLQIHTTVKYGVSDPKRPKKCPGIVTPKNFGGRKSLPIAKNDPKPSHEFSDQIGPPTHKTQGFCKNSHEKVHRNFAKNLGRQILGNAFSMPQKLALSTNLYFASALRPCIGLCHDKEIVHGPT